MLSIATNMSADDFLLLPNFDSQYRVSPLAGICCPRQCPSPDANYESYRASQGLCCRRDTLMDAVMREFGDEPKFLSFGAFETAGFFATILVALYSFVRNPEGLQGEDDQAEYDVYSRWRCAIIVIAVHVTLMVTVLIYLVVNGTTAKATWWVLALMLAPWAPLAGKVRNTITAWGRVREMMISRVTRNEVAAIVRERFKFGQRALSLPLVVHYAHRGRYLPVYPMEAMKAHPAFRALENDVLHQAQVAMETGNKSALKLGTLWTVDQGPQPEDIGAIGRLTRLYLSRWDPLAYLWTKPERKLPCSPFPTLHPPFEDRGRQARILDMVDSLQQGGTISDGQMQRAMNGRHCLHCRLATRGAVEAFMESSVKSHGDIRPHVWLNPRQKYGEYICIPFFWKFGILLLAPLSGARRADTLALGEGRELSYHMQKTERETDQN
jgi:hypothetical protein